MQAGGGGRCAATRLDLTSLDCTLKMVKTVNPILGVFHHNKNELKISYVSSLKRRAEHHSAGIGLMLLDVRADVPVAEGSAGTASVACSTRSLGAGVRSDSLGSAWGLTAQSQGR